ncbi:MAG: phosphopantothenoylcysteine decarboxylase, partial [Planctomycetes bacterium]|nr:phosphopantothenoylcysteine decarboxylase [Planctomycetota bacterium]
DIVATLGRSKGDRWAVGFALETEDRRLRALAKLEKKSCDLMVLNGPEAMDSPDNHVELIDPTGSVLQTISGSKEHVAREIFRVIQERLID